MFASYQAVLTRPGALAFSLSGLVGRLPISMVSLGLVLLVADATGSYGAAGAVAAAYVIGAALFAVINGRLIDRFGQQRVLPVAITLSSASLAATMLAVQHGASVPVPHLLAALAGASMPQIGSCVRARWAHLLRDDPRLHTAFSLEAVLDETVFILGPTVVTILATAWHPVAGLTTAIVCGLAGSLALSAQTRTQPPPGPPRRSAGPRPAMPWGVLVVLIGTSAMLGAVFGGAEVATVALADERGRPAWAGPLLGVWALGSLLAGLVFGAVAWRSSNLTRFRWAATALAVSLVPLPFIGSLLVLTPVLLLAGLAISPTLITLTALVEQSVPPARLTEGLAVVHSGMAAGIAPGAAIVGTVVDAQGASASFWVVAAAGALGAATAWTLRHRRVGAGRAPVHTPTAPVP